MPCLEVQPGEESCLVPYLEVDQVREVVLCHVLKWTGPGDQVRKIGPVNLSGKGP